MIADATTHAKPQVILVVSPVLVNARVAAAMIGLSSRSWRRLSAAGLTPLPIRLGGRSIRWNPDELAAWSEAGCPTRHVWEETKTARRTTRAMPVA